MSERQPRSDVFGTARSSPNDTESGSRSRFNRYDFLLAAIPIVLLIGFLTGYFTSVPDWIALVAGALPAVLMLIDGLALHPPTQP